MATVIDGIAYQICTPNLYPEVVDFYFDVFLKDEPTTVAHGGYKNRHHGIIKQVEDIMHEGVSLVALDAANSNQLVGILLAHTEKKNDVSPKMTYTDYVKKYPPLHASVMTLFDEILYPGDIFSKYPEEEKLYDIFTLATKSSHRGKRIGSRLVEQSLQVAEKVECGAAIVLATSDFTRKILSKLEFQVIASKEWKECIYDQGKPAFGQVTSDNATAHFLKL